MSRPAAADARIVADGPAERARPAPGLPAERARPAPGLPAERARPAPGLPAERVRLAPCCPPTGRATGCRLAAPRGKTFPCDCCSVAAGQVNGDYALVGYRAFCVADGIGGAAYGPLFARLACHTAVRAGDFGCTADVAAKRAAQRVARLREECDLERGGAALLVGTFEEDGMRLAWMGDVVAYRLRGSSLARMTCPHRRAGGLAHAAGPATAFASHVHVTLAPGDRLAVCTDGLWANVDESAMARTIAEASGPREATCGLVLGRRLPDDATAFVLYC